MMTSGIITLALLESWAGESQFNQSSPSGRTLFAEMKMEALDADADELAPYP
jgi:hypothetical protein